MTPSMFCLLMLVPVAILVTTHFVGDFLLQSSWMASNKGGSLLPLSVHVAVYTLTLFALSLLLLTAANASGLTLLAFDWKHVAMTAIGNGFAHFLVDFVTSKITSWAWREQKVRLFFIVIGFDQLLHTLCLLLSIPLFLY